MRATVSAARLGGNLVRARVFPVNAAQCASRPSPMPLSCGAARCFASLSSTTPAFLALPAVPACASSSSAPRGENVDDDDAIPVASSSSPPYHTLSSSNSISSGSSNHSGSSVHNYPAGSFSSHIPDGLSPFERRQSRLSSASSASATATSATGAAGSGMAAATGPGETDGSSDPFADSNEPTPLRCASQEWVSDASKPIRERYHGAMFNFHFFAGNTPCRPLGLSYSEVMATLSDPRTSPFSSSGADLLPWLFPSLEGSSENLDSAPLEPEEISAFHHYPEILRNYCRAVEAALARMSVTADISSGRIASSRRSLELCTVPIPVFASTISCIVASLRDMGFHAQAFSVVESLARTVGSTGNRLQPLYVAAMNEWALQVHPDDQVKLQTLFRYWNSTGSFVKWTALLHMRKMQVQKATMLNRASDYTLHHVVKAGTPEARSIGTHMSASAAAAAAAGSNMRIGAPAVPPPPPSDGAHSASTTAAAGEADSPAAAAPAAADDDEQVVIVAAAPGSSRPRGPLTPSQRQALKEARRSQWAQRREGAMAARWYSGVYADAVNEGGASRDMKQIVTGGGARQTTMGKLPAYHVQVAAMRRSQEKAREMAEARQRAEADKQQQQQQGQGQEGMAGEDKGDLGRG